MGNNPPQVFRNMILVLSPYLCVVAAQFLLIYPLHTVMDLPRWDEAISMGLGERFLHGGTLGPLSGSPIYALLYSIFVRIFETVDSVFYMHYFVKISVSVLFLLFLVEHTQSHLLSLILTLIWVLSGVNISEKVLVYHVALGFFLLALFFINKHEFIALLFLCLSTLTRFEYIFPTIAFAAYLFFRSGFRNENGLLKSVHRNISITLSSLMAFLLVILLFYLIANISNFNPGSSRTWFAFNQNYARHEVESGRYNLNPYNDSNIVIQNDFPDANSLTDAFLVNHKLFLNHLLRNIAMLPKATTKFIYPYVRGFRAGILYGVFVGFIIIILTQATVTNYKMFFSGLQHAIQERKKILYLTPVCISALIPILLVYPLPHHTLIMTPICLFWIGIVYLQALKTINFEKFTRWSLINLNLLFILSILVVDKPYTSKHSERPVYNQITQLIKVWPNEKLKLMGVGASWYASYIGSQNVLPIEPLATVYGGKIENDSVDLRILIKKHNPDVILINKVLVDSKNFNTRSLEVLHSDQWAKYPIGNDTLYFLKETFKR